LRVKDEDDEEDVDEDDGDDEDDAAAAAAASSFADVIPQESRMRPNEPVMHAPMVQGGKGALGRARPLVSAGRKRPAVKATPASGRKATAGKAATAAAKGFMTASNWSHAFSASSPATGPKTWSRKLGLCTKFPSGKQSENES